MLLSLDLVFDRMLLPEAFLASDRLADCEPVLQVSWLNLPPVLIALDNATFDQKRVLDFGGRGKALIFELSETGYRVTLRRAASSSGPPVDLEDYEHAPSNLASSEIDVQLKYSTDFDLRLALLALPRGGVEVPEEMIDNTPNEDATSAETALDANPNVTDDEKPDADEAGRNCSTTADLLTENKNNLGKTNLPPVGAFLVAFSTLHCAELVRLSALGYVHAKLEGIQQESILVSQPFRAHALSLENPHIAGQVALSFHMRIVPYFADADETNAGLTTTTKEPFPTASRNQANSSPGFYNGQHDVDMMYDEEEMYSVYLPSNGSETHSRRGRHPMDANASRNALHGKQVFEGPRPRRGSGTSRGPQIKAVGAATSRADHSKHKPPPSTVVQEMEQTSEAANAGRDIFTPGAVRFLRTPLSTPADGDDGADGCWAQGGTEIPVCYQ
ncbi:unnamed protein product [Amoebophrya sp. A120]|nr:unnamed protein product [Amoebophrya sp. A120]|eukprot:GSA120T00001690001.1